METELKIQKAQQNSKVVNNENKCRVEEQIEQDKNVQTRALKKIENDMEIEKKKREQRQY